MGREEDRKSRRRSNQRADAGLTIGTALPLFLLVAVPRKKTRKLDVGLLGCWTSTPRDARQPVGWVGEVWHHASFWAEPAI